MPFEVLAFPGRRFVEVFPDVFGPAVDVTTEVLSSGFFAVADIRPIWMFWGGREC
jgi:hypothetical protein